MARRKQTMAIKNIPLKQALEEFFLEKRSANLSEQTLKVYKQHLDMFISDLQIQHLPANISKKEYLWWIEELQMRRVKDVTIASYCRSIRAFIYWLQDQEYTEKCDLAIPKYQKTIKKTYEDAEIKLLLTDPRPCSEVVYQTWVFINLIFATGLRLSSALHIKVKDWDKRNATIDINYTKNNNAIVINLNSALNNILNKYIEYFDLKLDDYLFCTADKTILAKRTIEDNVATYNRALGVNKTSIHLMRHTFAKNYYTKTRDIYALCRILDHSDISTTQQYLRDFGITPDISTAYNPQLLVQEEKKRTRRGKVTK